VVVCSSLSVLRFLNIALDQFRWGGSIKIILIQKKAPAKSNIASAVIFNDYAERFIEDLILLSPLSRSY